MKLSSENSKDLEDAKALINRGLSLHKFERYRKAIEFYDESIKIYPNYFNAWLNKGIAYEKLNLFHEAIICFNIALSINPHEKRLLLYKPRNTIYGVAVWNVCLYFAIILQ